MNTKTKPNQSHHTTPHHTWASKQKVDPTDQVKMVVTDIVLPE